MKRVVHLAAGIIAAALILNSPSFVAHRAVHAAALGPLTFAEGHLVVSRSVYEGAAALITVAQPLPRGL